MDLATKLALIDAAARSFHLASAADETGTPLPTLESLTRLLSEAVRESLNPQRALMLTARVAASLEKSEGPD